jgi:hypothetical protein
MHVLSRSTGSRRGIPKARIFVTVFLSNHACTGRQKDLPPLYQTFGKRTVLPITLYAMRAYSTVHKNGFETGSAPIRDCPIPAVRSSYPAKPLLHRQAFLQCHGLSCTTKIQKKLRDTEYNNEKTIPKA